MASGAIGDGVADGSDVAESVAVAPGSAGAVGSDVSDRDASLSGELLAVDVIGELIVGAGDELDNVDVVDPVVTRDGDPDPCLTTAIKATTAATDATTATATAPRRFTLRNRVTNCVEYPIGCGVMRNRPAMRSKPPSCALQRARALIG